MSLISILLCQQKISFKTNIIEITEKLNIRWSKDFDIVEVEDALISLRAENEEEINEGVREYIMEKYDFEFRKSN